MAKRAIIMAAGTSTRFVPNALEYPKGLTRVRGEILIERQIRQLRDTGVEEIIVVTGYKAEAYDYLKDQGIRLIFNPDFQTRNNHSSLYVAKEYLEDCFICSADNYFISNPFWDPSLLSYYAGVYQEGETKEWVMKTDAHCRITSVTVGGRDSWVMLGHAYFNQSFGQKFRQILIDEYPHQETKPKFWENLFIDHISELTMLMKRYPNNWIFEFDSLDELRAFDESYWSNPQSKLLSDISERLEASAKKIHGFYPIRQDNLAIGFGFKKGKKKYVYLCSDQQLMKKKAYNRLEEK